MLFQTYLQQYEKATSQVDTATLVAEYNFSSTNFEFAEEIEHYKCLK